MSNRKLLLVKNGYGKPYLASHFDLHYNIFHAGKYIVVAMSRNKPVGIDVEVMK